MEQLRLAIGRNARAYLEKFREPATSPEFAVATQIPRLASSTLDGASRLKVNCPV
jgi:hypothetical protein